MYATFEDFQKFGKQQFDAVAAAATSLTKGWQELAAETTKIGELYARLAKEAFKPIETAYAAVQPK